MRPPNEKQAIAELIESVADLLSTSPSKIQVRHVGRAQPYDYAIVVPGHRFIAEYTSSASAGSVAAAINGLKCSAEASTDAGLPLVVVPFMGPVGQQLCDQARVSWLDLSGNAKIVAPGLRIWIEGRPNKYIERGRPPNVFAPKSSRITRQLLLHPKRFWSQVELVRQTGLDDGYVSKIVRRLKHEHYLDANENDAVRPRDPNLLLDAWYDAYDFAHHRIIQGHVPARSGDELLLRVVKEVSRQKLAWAVTGLGAAWLYSHFAAFRLATIYLSAMPPRSLLRDIEFADEPKGANLWLVVPDDEGVFHGSQVQEGIRCVSPVQTYLDLKGQPERAKDAAVELRRQFLHWGRHGA
jgi:hypothetical protein